MGTARPALSNARSAPPVADGAGSTLPEGGLGDCERGGESWSLSSSAESTTALTRPSLAPLAPPLCDERACEPKRTVEPEPEPKREKPIPMGGQPAIKDELLGPTAEGHRALASGALAALDPAHDPGAATPHAVGASLLVPQASPAYEALLASRTRAGRSFRLLSICLSMSMNRGDCTCSSVDDCCAARELTGGTCTVDCSGPARARSHSDCVGSAAVSSEICASAISSS